MNLDKCEIITTCEFGSTYQNTHDEYSDKDLMSLVTQPLEDTIFRNSEKSAKHVDDHRYYPVERFITLIGKGGFDNLLMLCAQLEQAEDSRFNKEVLTELYEPKVFGSFVASQLKPLTYSVIGNLDRLMKKEFLSGKDYIKFLTFIEHLKNLNEAINTRPPLIYFQKYQTYDSICKVDLGCAITRKRDPVVLEGVGWKMNKFSTEEFITQVKKDLKEIELVLKDYSIWRQKFMDKLESRTVDFLI